MPGKAGYEEKMRSSSRDKELKKKLKKKILGKKKDGVQDGVTTRRVASRRRRAGPKLSSRLYKRIGSLLGKLKVWQ